MSCTCTCTYIRPYCDSFSAVERPDDVIREHCRSRRNKDELPSVQSLVERQRKAGHQAACSQPQSQTNVLPCFCTSKTKIFTISELVWQLTFTFQTWCSAITPEYAEQAVSTDVHANPIYRVKGVLSNNPDFAEAFSCPTGSPMNPEKKCAVW